jgi:hypothetical protein
MVPMNMDRMTRDAMTVKLTKKRMASPGLAIACVQRQSGFGSSSA